MQYFTCHVHVCERLVSSHSEQSLSLPCTLSSDYIDMFYKYVCLNHMYYK